MDPEVLRQFATGDSPPLCPAVPVNKIMAPENMKCAFCGKFLSVVPIFHNGLESICGCCFNNNVGIKNCSNWKRQILYEKMAEYINFPCSNEVYGCNKLLNLNEVETHEESCKYKLMCPFSSDSLEIQLCDWSGSDVADLKIHLEDIHEDLIVELPEINFFNVGRIQILLTRVFTQLVVAEIKCEENEKFSCLVMLIGSSVESKNFRYQLELYDENKNNSLILRKSRLESILEYGKILQDKDKRLIIDLNTIKQHLGSFSTVFGKLEILQTVVKDESKNKVGEGSQKLRLDEKLLEELECPVCNNYMLPPIFVCKTGHSFCHVCRRQLSICPICKDPLQDRRNFTVEKLTSVMAYPCLFKAKGCSFIGNASEIVAHQSICEFSGLKCFLGIDCRPVQNMFQHMNSDHANILLHFGKMQLLDLCDLIVEAGTKQFGLCNEGNAFRLSMKFVCEQLFVSLHQFEILPSKFLYALDIINGENKLTMETKCASIDEPVYPNTCLSIPQTMLSKYVEGGVMFFKLRLMERST